MYLYIISVCINRIKAVECAARIALKIINTFRSNGSSKWPFLKSHRCGGRNCCPAMNWSGLKGLPYLFNVNYHNADGVA